MSFALRKKDLIDVESSGPDQSEMNERIVISCPPADTLLVRKEGRRRHNKDRKGDTSDRFVCASSQMHE